MKWASHLSTQNNIEACVAESVEAIIRQMDGKSVDLTIIFVSPQFKDKYEEIPQLIRDRISSGHFLGCSGGGIVGGGKEAEQQAAFSITCANLPDVEIKGIHTDTMKLPDQDTAPSVWREWLEVDVEKMFSLLNVPIEKISDKKISDVKNRVAGISKTFDQVSDALKSSARDIFGCDLVSFKLNDEELESCQKLMDEKFSSKNWTFRR